MKKIIRIALATVLLFSVFACTKKEEVTYDLAGKTYYNTVDEYGNNDHSKIWFGKDGSFVLTDNFYEGFYEASGTWSIKENVCTLEVEKIAVGNYDKIIFEIQDDDTLILRTSLAGSRSGQTFSTTEVKGYETGSDSKFTYTVYYNTTQTTKEISSVEIRTDNSFTFLDKNDLSVAEINGTFTQDGNTLIMKRDDNGESFEMLIEDEKTLVLQNDVGISATGDKFSSDYKKSEASKPETKEVPCTKITSMYKNYWSVEGTKNWDLGIKAEPANTTDKLVFKSNDEKVVTIDDQGRASAISAGKTTIDITCGSQKLTIGFETKGKGPKSIDATSELVILLGQSDKIKVKVSPDTADQTVTFKSDDTFVCTVDSNGNVKAVNPGVTEVYATTSNGLSAATQICVEGEKVFFEMENNVSVKAGSGQKIPYKVEHLTCYDWNTYRNDVTEYADFHTAYTSALDIDGHGNVYAKGAVYETVDIDVYFTYTDGSSLNVTSPTFVVHVEK